ncbi:PAS domain-containing sensor histidine kinase [Pseudotabrizicola sp. L79]|uniref:PAS domain-containing sensor histidine kinase n=1 Tax=Pseudotabrizicola sp. L79 TaxID=3118402 RepID=UPI002F932C86
MEHQAVEFDLQDRALQAHAIVSVTDRDGILLMVNENFESAFGKTRDQLLGMSEADLHWDGRDDQTFLDMQRQLQSGQTWTGESRVRGADGSMLCMQGTVVPFHDKSGRLIKNVAIRTDVTNARKAKDARFLKTLFDQLHDEVYIYDVDTLAIRYMNLRAMDRCNMSPETITSKRISDCDPAFEEGAFRAYVAPLFTKETESVTVEVDQAKGPVEVKTRIYTADDGQELFVSVLRDITERKRIERARLETVSVVSHELRTPLTSIKGALRLLKSGVLGPISDEMRPILEIADRNSERLLLVVNDILDLEKIRAGKMDFTPKPTDLVAFLSDAVSMNKGYGDEHNVRFALETSLQSATADINYDRMMQVMSNLMSNAAKFSPTGGTVRIGLEQRKNRFRVTVSDDGPGIPESARQAVFESFAQLDNVDTSKRKGTGLGLTISKTIVDAHRGKLDFHSTVGKGTTFFVDLPISVASQQDDTGSTAIAAE